MRILSSIMVMMLWLISSTNAGTYSIDLPYGQYDVGYTILSDKTVLWQPCSKCSGKPLTLKDMGSDKLLTALKAENMSISDVQLKAVFLQDKINSDHPLIIVPGGYLKTAFVITGEFLASHGYQVLFLGTTEQGFENYVKEISQQISEQKKLINSVQSRAFLGFHTGSGVALTLANEVEVKGLIAIEGNETWKSKSYGWPKLSTFLDPSRIDIPIHRIFTANPKPDWYFSSPKNTVLDFYEVYTADVKITELDPTIEHDELTDLSLWFTWQPQMKESGSDSHLDEYKRMLELVLQQLTDWK